MGGDCREMRRENEPADEWPVAWHLASGAAVFSRRARQLMAASACAYVKKVM